MNRARILIILLALGLTACELQNPELGFEVSDVITLKVDTLALEADGLTRITITATLGEKINANQLVLFETESGTFAGGEGSSFQTTTSGKEAIAILQVSRDVLPQVIASATVSGTFDGQSEPTDFRAVVFLEYVAALADTMLVVPADLEIPADKATMGFINVDLLRTSGMVSRNIPILVDVSPVDTSQAIAIFPGIVNVEDQSIQVGIKSANGEAGKVAVTIEAQGSGGRSLSQTVILEFVTP